jgi:hypothetical protein
MSHPWEKKENPQTYSIMPTFGEHPDPRQHTLGLVGGNSVPYSTRLLQVDAESDLRGITRANTFCPTREHTPLPYDVTSISRDTPKEKTTITLSTRPLKSVQMWGYPATLAPENFVIETCGRPEKY